MKPLEPLKPVEDKVGIMPDSFNPIVLLEDIPGSECEKRALEVALAGGYSIAFLCNEGSMAPKLMKAGMRLAGQTPVPFHGLAYPWCPCGNYGSPKIECRCSAKKIGAHLSKLGKRINEFTIWMGASVPLARHMNIKGESEAVILKRIQAGRLAPEPDDSINQSCRELLDMVVNQYVSIDIARVKAIAKTIARMEGRDKIDVQHLSEAIQYQPQVLHGFREWIKPSAISVKS